MLYGYIEDLKGSVRYPIHVSELEMTGIGETIRGSFVVDYHAQDLLASIARKGILNPSARKVIFNPPATVILWSDGSKTVVKCGEQDAFDPEKGLVMAITKKLLGNKGNYYNVIKNLLKDADYTYKEVSENE